MTVRAPSGAILREADAQIPSDLFSTQDNRSVSYSLGDRLGSLLHLRVRASTGECASGDAWTLHCCLDVSSYCEIDSQVDPCTQARG